MDIEKGELLNMKILVVVFTLCIILSFFTALQGKPPVDIRLLANELSNISGNFESTMKAFQTMQNMLTATMNWASSPYDVLLKLWNGGNWEWNMLLSIPKAFVGGIATYLLYAVSYVWVMLNFLFDIVTSAYSFIVVVNNVTGGMFIPLPDFVTNPR